VPCEIYFDDRWITVEGDVKAVLNELAGAPERSFVQFTSADGDELWLRPTAVLGVAPVHDHSAFAGNEGADLESDEE
jgi:hypothetical protein